jgi:hypothetical protein
MSLKFPAGIAQAGRSLKLLRNSPWFVSARTTVVHQHSFVGVNVGASAHAYGAWAQLVASTSANVGLVFFDGQSATGGGNNNSCMWNIGVGAAGSEQIIVPDFATGGVSSLGFGAWIPVSIPAGSRVAVQAKVGNIVSNQRFPNWYLLSTGAAAYSQTPRAVEVLGVNPSTSQGTALSGASGSWTEIVASTSKPYQSLFLMPTIHGTNTAAINPLRLVLGVGPSGSEVEVGEETARTTANEELSAETIRPHVMWHCGPIPAGTRIAVKHNIPTNPDQYGVNIIAVPYA